MSQPALVDYLVHWGLGRGQLKRLTVRRPCEPESLGWYLVHWGLDRGWLKRLVVKWRSQTLWWWRPLSSWREIRCVLTSGRSDNFVKRSRSLAFGQGGGVVTRSLVH